MEKLTTEAEPRRREWKYTFNNQSSINMVRDRSFQQVFEEFLDIHGKNMARNRSFQQEFEEFLDIQENYLDMVRPKPVNRQQQACPQQQAYPQQQTYPQHQAHPQHHQQEVLVNSLESARSERDVNVMEAVEGLLLLFSWPVEIYDEEAGNNDKQPDAGKT